MAEPMRIVFGLRRNGRRNRQHRCGIAVIDQVVFREPDIIKTMLVCPTDLLENFAVDLRVRTLPAEGLRKSYKRPKFNCDCLVLAHGFLLTALDCHWLDGTAQLLDDVFNIG